MLQSKLFTKTEKETPSGVTLKSHELLYRAGFIRESVAGRYNFLPLGMILHDKITDIIAEEMEKVGSQKILIPTLHQIELWEETNRTNTAGFELMVVEDRRGARFALGGTAEEMMVDLIRKFNISYRDLPVNIYQFSNKFRDELRARGGLLRTREFIMKDAYSFDVNEEAFQKTYKKMWKSYNKIFNRLGLETLVAETDNGYMGGEYSHEFIVKSDVGESKILTTESGKYVAHEEIARFKRTGGNAKDKEEKMEEIEAKREASMEAGVKLHKVPIERHIKNVVFVNDKDETILAALRGDLDVNEVKLKKVTDSIELRAATEEEIEKIGSVPGFISPVGINKKKIKIVGDTSLRTIKNAYTGGNKKHLDLKNVNIDRDYTLDIEEDIALAKEGHLSEKDEEFSAVKGIEVGNIFQLGYHYSKLMKAGYKSQDGKTEMYYMGSYGIGIGRTMAAIAEVSSDENGLIWPESVAPFKFHIVALDVKNEDVRKEAEGIYKMMTGSGIEVLYDDRDLGAGEKFAESDLIGIPYRIVVSEKNLKEGMLEIKERKTGEVKKVEKDKILKSLLGE